MAKVEVAAKAGACYGVQRALELVWQTVERAQGPICTLGPIIHNPTIVHELEDRGACVVDAPEDAPAGATLILRTHGVPPTVEQRAAAAGLETLDATCPFVKKVHVAAERLAQEDYDVVVVGESGHPEVEGTLGHVTGAIVVGSAEEAIRARVGRRVGLVVQTTLAESVLRDVVGALLSRCDEVRVLNTICSATSERQQAAADLASQSDVMVVIGGRNSANTTHLADICRERCAATYHIELADELDPSWFQGVERIGITAGASTPFSQIEDVRQRVLQYTR